uniref:Uncharacterized protein n=1 Tax=Meloidogyne enterolobii TaxID=390850 RepID=A0A6V7V240_MELEN|nr:unnamed protein product [Meloidogyne enterolobii]
MSKIILLSVIGILNIFLIRTDAFNDCSDNCGYGGYDSYEMGNGMHNGMGNGMMYHDNFNNSPYWYGNTHHFHHPYSWGIQSIFIVHMDLVEDLEVMEEEDMEEDIHSITTTIAITTITLIIEGRNNHINLIDKRFYL